jgi:tetratricopeptide (TPR) repeat protein
MAFSHRCLCLCTLTLIATPIVADPSAPLSPALKLWERGQEAMLQGDLDAAARCYHESLQLDPNLARNYLSLAALHVARSEDAQAAPWLARYIEAQPDHCVVRMHYADLLLRIARPAEARKQMERFVVDVQDRPELAQEHLVDCHTRLAELALAMEDEYGEHLNRGIGLYLLARQRAEITEEIPGPTAEALYLKAATELFLARQCRPREARPSWYLHEVWSKLGQHHPAQRYLRAAEAAAPFTILTPVERRELTLACRNRDDESGRR